MKLCIRCQSPIPTKRMVNGGHPWTDSGRQRKPQTKFCSKQCRKAHWHATHKRDREPSLGQWDTELGAQFLRRAWR